ncbi:restriction enzyme subunit beta [Pasteurella multocida subsp. multocida OH4807]|nr:restriction enzyme subunit beta [Pasteurella multocida subsp. multocida OH4807]
MIKSDMKSGDIPFIGASDSNNGITEFVSNINSSLDKNILGVNYNGSVVENFYHPYQCIFSDDVKRLELKYELSRNKWVYLFLKTVILKQKEKYQYGYKFNAQRMIKQKILLPITPQGEIHFEFIEKMMMEKELFQVIKLLAYFNSK